MAPNLRSDDYYEILGCPRNADDATLKKAYRKLAVKVSQAKQDGRLDSWKDQVVVYASIPPHYLYLHLTSHLL
jgi:preprotein translocase subunit Sec63